MHLNLNDEIRVKLTERGKDIYYHQYDWFNTAFEIEVCKPSYPKVDEAGYTTFQLWRFMQLYGVHIGMGLPNVIEPLDIVFDAPIIEPERKKGAIQKFHEYQVEWLLSHCDLELEPQLEEWVVRFLHDTADCYMMEIYSAEGEHK